MRQMYGDRLSIPVLPIKPPSDAAGVYGAVMDNFSAAMKLAKMAIKLSITGGTSTTLFMYGMDANDQSFGLISDVGNLGQLGGITIPTGDEYLFVVRDIGWLAELALVEKSAVGATASLSCGTVSTNWNTVVQAVAAGGSGNQVQVVLSPTGTTKAGTLTELNDSLVCASIFAYLPGVSTVQDMENLITNTPSKLLAIKTTGTEANVLQTTDAFGPVSLAGGTPVTTATLIEIIENNYRRAD
jgi:hypothetical protein